MAIVMMTADIDMPGRRSQSWHNRDIARIGDIALAAFEILEGCVQSSTGLASSPGWKNVGMPYLSPKLYFLLSNIGHCKSLLLHIVS